MSGLRFGPTLSVLAIHPVMRSRSVEELLARRLACSRLRPVVGDSGRADLRELDWEREVGFSVVT